MNAVDVRNLVKTYKIYQSPSQRMKEIILRKSFHTDFTALGDLTFSVMRGETFGIIGENGAGKSTLLKILAKTLKPTSGAVSVQGRTAALLELGTGFNPELTGEENIYLNAYLMGLSKAEIDDRKQEIIDFSELGDFVARPIKTYSSGMYVRLAFSIATSVDPDILIIDEALSVGDEYFQKKCVDRMMQFRESGKTILFCSHSMYHVQELCKRVLWLNKGRIKLIGETGAVIAEYQNYERGKTAALQEHAEAKVQRSAQGDGGPLRIVDVKILDKNDVETDGLRSFEPVSVSFTLRCQREGMQGHVGFAITRNDEVMVFGTMTKFDGLPAMTFKDGQVLTIRINALPVLAGLYHFVLVAADEHAVHPYDMVKTKNIAILHRGKEFGMAFVEHQWNLS